VSAVQYTVKRKHMNIEFRATDVSVDVEPGLIGFTDVESEQCFYLQPAELSNGSFDPTKEQIWLERDDQGYGSPGQIGALY
jgi:hypothetical protein